MIGLLLNEIERQELEFLLIHEMEEILLYLDDERMKPIVKNAMIDKYKIIFALFKRITPRKDWANYLLPNKKIYPKANVSFDE